MSDHGSRGGPRLVFGIVLILLGVVFSLDRLGLVRAEDVLDFWPVIFVVVGLSKIVFPASGGSRFSGFVLLVVGSWLLLEELRWIDVDFSDWWPVLLVLVGLRLAWQGLFGRSEGDGDASDLSIVNAVAILGGSKRISRSEAFRGGDLVAFMGGCEIDLTRARIARSPAVIDAFAMWGGVEIKVPRDWRVTVKGIPLLGGYEDQTSSDDDLDPTQQLIVKGFAIMGGVEVKN